MRFFALDSGAPKSEGHHVSFSACNLKANMVGMKGYARSASIIVLLLSANFWWPDSGNLAKKATKKSPTGAHT